MLPVWCRRLRLPPPGLLRGQRTQIITTTGRQGLPAKSSEVPYFVTIAWYVVSMPIMDGNNPFQSGLESFVSRIFLMKGVFSIRWTLVFSIRWKSVFLIKIGQLDKNWYFQWIDEDSSWWRWVFLIRRSRLDKKPFIIDVSNWEGAGVRNWWKLPTDSTIKLPTWGRGVSKIRKYCRRCLMFMNGP